MTLTDKANGKVIADAIKLVATTGGTTSEVVRYLHTDHLNTPRLATDQQGQKVWGWEGEAFGNTQPTGTVTINLRFPGQYYDSETGLHYNWNRYYDPKIGRYVSYDPLGVVPGVGTPLTGVPGYIRKYLRSVSLKQQLVRGLNQPYGYTRSNPMRWTDSSGLTSLAACLNPVNAAVCAEAGIIAGRPAVPLISPIISATPKPGSKPKDCPTGTLPIDQYPGLDKDKIHGIKDGVGAGPTDWTGIAPNGDVITGDAEGNAQNHGPLSDYIPGGWN